MPSQIAHQFPIEVEQETNGRWIAAIPEVPGVMAYGATLEKAIAVALFDRVKQNGRSRQ